MRRRRGWLSVGRAVSVAAPFLPVACGSNHLTVAHFFLLLSGRLMIGIRRRAQHLHWRVGLSW
jgi:hypothetical protein